MTRNIDDYMTMIEEAWGGTPDPNFIKIFEFGISTVDAQNPKGSFSGKGIIDKKYIEKITSAYQLDKQKKVILKDVQTSADPAVDSIAIFAGKIDQKDSALASEAHRWLMQAENILGTLLEKYIDSKLSSYGWLWCAGSFIKAVDFIYLKDSDKKYYILQIKNSDNSENSSSSAIRAGTEIEKWFRRYSKTGETAWKKLNEKVEKLSMVNPQFSETDFLRYIQEVVK